MKKLSPLLLLAACAVAPDTSDLTQDIKCDDWMCGTNSPTVGGVSFFDLHLGGDKNKQGFSIENFFDKDGNPFKLGVERGYIRGYPFQGIGVLSNNDLEGAYLNILLDGNAAYRIRIAAVNTIDYWAKVGGQTIPLETYLLEYTEIGPGIPIEYKNLCSAATSNPDLGMNGYHTTVFEGDRIDAASKTIDDQIDTNWFNLGCAGSALAKLQLTGHTYAASLNHFDTDTGQRQTALKMFTADYCGTGKAFTVPGQPLQWADDKGTMTVEVKSVLEALWTKDGARCLNKPRVAVNHSDLGDSLFPDIEAAIEAECKRPPECPDDDGTTQGFHLLSANPVP